MVGMEQGLMEAGGKVRELRGVRDMLNRKGGINLGYLYFFSDNWFCGFNGFREKFSGI